MKPTIFSTAAISQAIHAVLLEAQTKAGRIEVVTAAVLDSKGSLIDVVGNSPLHFASFEATINATKKYISPKPSEVLITNDPFSGNTRLCDLMFMQFDGRYWVAIQTAVPELLNKNLTSLAKNIDDEGFRIPPTPLDEGSTVNPALVDYLAASGISRDRLLKTMGDAKTALKFAMSQISNLETKWGIEVFKGALKELDQYSEKMIARSLHEIPDGEYEAHDFLDNDGVSTSPLKVQCNLKVSGENILLSFQGTSKQTAGPFNCNYAVTLSACFWVIMGLTKEKVPINSGAFRAFSLEAPDGTLVNARSPAPLLGGYFDTSKRIVDVLFLLLSKAFPFDIPALGGGTTEAVLMKFGSRLRVETLGAGSGATRNQAGENVVQTDVHNTELESIEETEMNWPIQVIQSSLREGSGGGGKNAGGNGIVRGYKFLDDVQVYLLGDRRVYKPHGLFGGVSAMGSEILINKKGEKKKVHNEKKSVSLSSGDTLVLQTPGGGGWGKKEE